MLAQLRGAGPLPARRSPRRLEARVKGLKDKTCWFCSDFLACWCGKIGIGVDGSQLEGWTTRGGCIVTFWLAGAGKSVLKVVVSSRVCVWPFGPSRWGLGRLFAPTVSTVPGHWRATGCATGGTASGSAWLPLGRLSQNVACNSPYTVSYYAFISLELQRLQALLNIHSVELHAKLLRASASNAHAGPLRRRLTAGRLTLVHPRARGPDLQKAHRAQVATRAPARTRAR